MNDNCIFCKIASGEIPSAAIYENDDFKVILDRFPGSLGHTLIIPKEHSENIFDLPENTAAKIMPLAQKIAIALRKSFNPDGINILQNNGGAAGQSVFHLHVHIIPRFTNDGVNMSWKPQQPEDEEFDKISALIKSNI